MNLKIALLISFVGHCCLLTPLGNSWFLIPDKKSPDIQVVYYKITPPAARAINDKETQSPPAPALASAPQETSKKTETSSIRKTRALKPKRPSPAQVEVSEAKQEAPPPSPARDNIVPTLIPGTNFPYTPECLSYHKYIKAEVRSSLRQRYNKNYSEGLIDIRFEVDRTGKLLALSILQDRSSADPELRALTSETIMRITPFKPFPKKISQERFNFHYQVEFKHQ